MLDAENRLGIVTRSDRLSSGLMWGQWGLALLLALTVSPAVWRNMGTQSRPHLGIAHTRAFAEAATLTVSGFIEAADEALYGAKRGGRNRVVTAARPEAP